MEKGEPRDLKRVQLLLAKIPKGKVTTYKEMGRKLGLNPRTVGMLLGRNCDLDRYPCYKVVGSDGSLRGYRGGVRQKVQRLRKDGITVERGKVDIAKYMFYF
jgi:alkylated DNA nucleotide flippase Atl1